MTYFDKSAIILFVENTLALLASSDVQNRRWLSQLTAGLQRKVSSDPCGIICRGIDTMEIIGIIITGITCICKIVDTVINITNHNKKN